MLQGTVVVGLLQPQPETFDLFDDVILLSSGKVSPFSWICDLPFLSMCLRPGYLRPSI